MVHAIICEAAPYAWLMDDALAIFQQKLQSLQMLATMGTRFTDDEKTIELSIRVALILTIDLSFPIIVTCY